MEYETKRGIKVVINEADFTTSMMLRGAVLKSIKNSDINISAIDLEQLNQEAITKLIIEAALSIDCDDKVTDALFKCLARCTYNGEKIIRDTFEPVEAREDYYEIVINCLKENLLPFFQPLLQRLRNLHASKSSNNPKQK
jgi:hypothetical protein